jgi:hypothetical protein
MCGCTVTNRADSLHIFSGRLEFNMLSSYDIFKMMEQDYDFELLLGLDGASYEAAAGYVVEFTVQ